MNRVDPGQRVEHRPGARIRPNGQPWKGVLAGDSSSSTLLAATPSPLAPMPNRGDRWVGRASDANGSIHRWEPI